MARIRSIKPTIWSDQRFIELSLQARLLCVGMISNADDDGRLVATGAALVGAIFPHDDVSPKAVEKWRDEIAKTGLIVVYTQGRGTYAAFPKWDKHQVIRKHMKSSLPTPPSASPSAAPSTAPTPDPVRTSRARDTERETETEAETGVEVAREAALTHREDPTMRLLIEHSNAYPEPLTPSQQAPVRTAIAQLVGERVDPDKIRAGLARMRERNLSARMLPELVVQATTPPPKRRGTADERVAGWLDLADRFAADSGPTAPKGITA